jgi:hypothetical protein
VTKINKTEAVMALKIIAQLGLDRLLARERVRAASPSLQADPLPQGERGPDAPTSPSGEGRTEGTETTKTVETRR